MVLLIFLVFSFCFLFSFSLLCVISSRVSGYVSAAQNIKRNRKKSAKKTCIKCLLKLGKSKDFLKYICLSFVSFCLYFISVAYIIWLADFLLPICCHFIITALRSLRNHYFDNMLQILHLQCKIYYESKLPIDNPVNSPFCHFNLPLFTAYNNIFLLLPLYLP